MKLCAECANGENTREAEYYITGYDHVDCRPVRMNVCSDHLYTIEDDGEIEIKSTKRIRQ